MLDRSKTHRTHGPAQRNHVDQIIVNNVPADTLGDGIRHYVGDESRIDRSRELNSSIVSERLSHGPLHRPQSS
jgi:hypothetical protein